MPLLAGGRTDCDKEVRGEIRMLDRDTPSRPVPAHDLCLYYCIVRYTNIVCLSSQSSRFHRRRYPSVLLISLVIIVVIFLIKLYCNRSPTRNPQSEI